MVCAVADHDSSWLGSIHKKIQGDDLMYRPNARAKKNDLREESPPCLLHTINVLMYSYGLSAAQDPDDNHWMSLTSAYAWMGTIEKLVCLGRRSQDPLFERITAAESSMRREWHSMSHRDPMSTLSEIITGTGKMVRYHLPSDFHPELSADAERNRPWRSYSSGPKGSERRWPHRPS